MINESAKNSTNQSNLAPLGNNLAAWLSLIEALHPKSIEMGLARVKKVFDQLNIQLKCPVITIGGTNGKGSTCAMLERIYSEAGYRVACYSSPHFIQFNERIRINLKNADDATIVAAFNTVESARQDTQLTYFEFSTLAAFWIFSQQNIDVAILEIGLGGRLDAVNIIEPNCAIVTSVDLDHMDYLGATREKIGFEKAGIYRAGKLAICGDESAPKSLTDFATEIGADFQLINRDFKVEKTGQGWQFSANKINLQLPALALHGDFQLNNAACAVCAVQHLTQRLPVPQANIGAALSAVTLMGRFYQTQSNPAIIMDVAHNPQAAKSLAHNLQSTPCAGRTLAVFAMLADKDIVGVMRELTPHISAWYLADIHNVRGAKAIDLQAKLGKLSQTAQLFANVAAALQAACKDATKNDRIVVFGSFYTVAEAIESLNFS